MVVFSTFPAYGPGQRSEKLQSETHSLLMTLMLHLTWKKGSRNWETTSLMHLICSVWELAKRKLKLWATCYYHQWWRPCSCPPISVPWVNSNWHTLSGHQNNKCIGKAFRTLGRLATQVWESIWLKSLKSWYTKHVSPAHCYIAVNPEPSILPQNRN